MSNLVTVADAAVPFDYAILPPGVEAILGYVGAPGCTPYEWTPGDIAEVHATGRAWFAIWVPPAGAINTQIGMQAGNAMMAALHARSYPPGWPVFLDIEQDSYAASPAGAEQAATAWGQVMRAHGWTYAYPYLPAAAGHGWIADWTGTAPTELPPGVIGQQYAGQCDGNQYDLSVIDRAILAYTPLSEGQPDMPLDAADLAKIHTTVSAEVNTQLGQWLPRLAALMLTGHANSHFDPANSGALIDNVGIYGRLVADTDPAGQANAIATALGPDLGAHVASVLAARLAT